MGKRRTKTPKKKSGEENRDSDPAAVQPSSWVCPKKEDLFPNKWDLFPSKSDFLDWCGKAMPKGFLTLHQLSMVMFGIVLLVCLFPGFFLVYSTCHSYLMKMLLRGLDEGDTPFGSLSLHIKAFCSNKPLLWNLHAISVVSFSQIFFVAIALGGFYLKRKYTNEAYNDGWYLPTWSSGEVIEDGDATSDEGEAERKTIGKFLRISTLAMIVYLFSLDLLWFRKGFVVSWNTMLFYTLAIPIVYIWYIGVLSAAKIALEMMTVLRGSGTRPVMPVVLYYGGFFCIPFVCAWTFRFFFSQASRYGLNIGGVGPRAVIYVSVLKFLIGHAKTWFVWQLNETQLADSKNETTQTKDNKKCDQENTNVHLLLDTFVDRDEPGLFWWASFARFTVVLGTQIHEHVSAALDTLLTVFKPAQRHHSKSSEPIHNLLVRLPFTYNFVVLTAIYAIALFNIMFHLLAATTSESETWLTSSLKFFVFFAVGQLLLPILFELTALVFDCWDNFHHVSKLASDFARLYSGIYNRHVLTTKQLQALMTPEKDREKTSAYDIAFRAVHFLVWKVVNIFFILALVSKLQLNEDALAIMRLGQSDDGNSIFINHTFVGVRLCKGENVKECSDTEESKETHGTEPYGVCNVKWGGLSALDFALLSNIVYFDMKGEVRMPQLRSDIDALLNFSFPKELYGSVKFVDDSLDPAEYKVNKSECYYSTSTSSCRRCKAGLGMPRFEKYIRVDFEDKNLTVISIRGTSPLSLADIIADIRLWSEPVLFNLASAFLPTLRIMSPGLIARIIQAIQQVQKFFEVENHDLDFHENIIRYIHCIQEKMPPEWSIAVTGHSLGGGLAAIVGSTLNLRTVAFSPPGLVMSRFKFQDPVLTETSRARQVEYRRPRLDRAGSKVVNIIPMRDIVPTADLHFGLTQNTVCLEGDPLHCHMLELQVCDLLRRCGDDFGGQRFSGCRFEKATTKELLVNTIRSGSSFVKNISTVFLKSRMKDGTMEDIMVEDSHAEL